ncbi:hypothetical protein HD_1324 [[Haemophilus] ducreyi 35000HP]|uniref:Uncharacterized protein n=1 Tax=Haemophilus ducreyi (strain 35000HP / ATCC 700724) TaxID=233412 RepID=Q7VLT9_HAEDU|nr:hypothetical protein HD_1324 [[Haemophilus] ducreyi 35000HP]
MLIYLQIPFTFCALFAIVGAILVVMLVECYLFYFR